MNVRSRHLSKYTFSNKIARVLYLISLDSYQALPIEPWADIYRVNNFYSYSLILHCLAENMSSYVVLTPYKTMRGTEYHTTHCLVWS